MYLTAAQRLINFVCSVCHVRWTRGCSRQHICSKYLKNRWRYYGKLKKNANAPWSQTHTCASFFYTVYTSKQYNYLMLGVSLSRIASERIYLKKLWYSIRRRNARRTRVCERVLRPRAAEMYNDITLSISNHNTQGIPSSPVDNLTTLRNLFFFFYRGNSIQRRKLRFTP